MILLKMTDNYLKEFYINKKQKTASNNFWFCYKKIYFQYVC